MDNERYQIIASLEAGEHPDIISKRLEIPKAKVLRVKIEYDKAIVDGTLDKLIDVDQLVILNSARALKEATPSLSEAIDAVSSDLGQGLDRLRSLDEQLIATAIFANTRIRSTIATSSTTVEICDMVQALCKLREAFFNKNVTQVNIQNNLPNSGQVYGDFLSDKPN